ncbi:hypothetical protein AMELA_G00241090 [Ameiurus melas]|uniref:Uncharacterized protein n=1 Tax=Ameiurus melas TaxID=219545 RepID=A0A7J5ZW08_AMEME|nr:hypothetical protein AMELA_G00241090 [Ameiurus melas]
MCACVNTDEDSLELHMVLVELEDVDKKAQLQEGRTALETSCASAYTSKGPCRDLSQPRSPSHRRQHTSGLG